MKQLAWQAAIVLATLTALALLWQLRFILAVFILSLFLAAAVRPLINRLAGRRMPVGLAQLLVYSAGIGAAGLVLYLAGEAFLKELELFSNWLAVQYTERYEVWADGLAWQQALAARLPAPEGLSELPVGLRQSLLMRSLVGITRSVATALGGLSLALALSIYWTVDQNRFERLWLSLLPADRRMGARTIWRDIEAALGAHLRSELTQSLLAALLLGLGYTWLQLDFPLLLALIAAIAWLVPLIGGVLVAGLAFWVGALNGPAVAVGATLLTLGVLAFLEWIVEPRLLPHRRYGPFLSLLLLLPLVEVFGLAGFILTPPMTALAQLGLRYSLQTRRRSGRVSTRLTELEGQLQQLRVEFQDALSDAGSPELASLAERLERLLHETQQLETA